MRITVEEFKKQATPHAQSQRIHELFLKQCKEAGLPEPETEHQFAKPRKWRFDFAFIVETQLLLVTLRNRIAVEIEGGLYVKGGHSRGAAYEKNLEKYNEATIRGWQLYRFSTGQVKDGTAIAFMKKVFGK